MVTTPDSLDYAMDHVVAIGEPEAAIADERRCTPRLSLDASARLIGSGESEPIPCRISDVAEGGMFVHVQEPCHLNLGGRYEIVVDDDASGGDLARAIGEGCYATVVRTTHVAEASVPMAGAGLRFDQPLML